MVSRTSVCECWVTRSEGAAQFCHEMEELKVGVAHDSPEAVRRGPPVCAGYRFTILACRVNGVYVDILDLDGVFDALLDLLLSYTIRSFLPKDGMPGGTIIPSPNGPMYWPFWPPF